VRQLRLVAAPGASIATPGVAVALRGASDSGRTSVICDVGRMDLCPIAVRPVAA